MCTDEYVYGVNLRVRNIPRYLQPLHGHAGAAGAGAAMKPRVATYFRVTHPFVSSFDLRATARVSADGRSRLRKAGAPHRLAPGARRVHGMSFFCISILSSLSWKPAVRLATVGSRGSRA